MLSTTFYRSSVSLLCHSCVSFFSVTIRPVCMFSFFCYPSSDMGTPLAVPVLRCVMCACVEMLLMQCWPSCGLLGRWSSPLPTCCPAFFPSTCNVKVLFSSFVWVLNVFPNSHPYKSWVRPGQRRWFSCQRILSIMSRKNDYRSKRYRFPKSFFPGDCSDVEKVSRIVNIPNVTYLHEIYVDNNEP